MAGSRQFENGYALYLSRKSSDFGQVWCASANFDSENGNVTYFYKLTGYPMNIGIANAIYRNSLKMKKNITKCVGPQQSSAPISIYQLYTGR